MYFLIIFLSLRSDVKPLVPFTVFRHFNTNGKKFTVSINFSVKNKIGSKRVNNILYSISSNFGHFPTIPDYFKRSAKTIEDFRRSKLPKMEEDYRWFPRRNLIIFIFISSSYIHMWKMHSFTVYRYDFFSERKLCNSF